MAGVPAVVQWVKNLTAAAPVTAEMRVLSLALCSRLKDLALLWLRHRLQLWLGSNPWPGKSTCCKHGLKNKLIKKEGKL